MPSSTLSYCAAAVAASISLVACSPACRPDASVPDLAAGTMDTNRVFQPLVEGTPLLTERGFQGGSHVFVTLRATGVSGDIRAEVRLSGATSGRSRGVFGPWDLQLGTTNTFLSSPVQVFIETGGLGPARLSVALSDDTGLCGSIDVGVNLVSSLPPTDAGVDSGADAGVADAGVSDGPGD